VIRLVVANQRGGVGKTTSVITLARCMAEMGKRVLIVDTDSQGSVAMALALKPTRFLADFVCKDYSLSECITPAYERIDVVCSNRSTLAAETQLSATVAKEMTFYSLFKGLEEHYDALLFDVAPSISHLQSCSLAYAQNVLIPVAMDALSVEGAKSSLSSISVLNQFFAITAGCVGFMPTQVDNRLRMTEMVLNSLKIMADQANTRVIHEIHQDQAVNHAMRSKQFLHDYDPRSKALQDYRAACKEILELIEVADEEAAATAR
jgi:chromosome partitioning protein